MESKLKLINNIKIHNFSGKIADWPFFKLKFTAPLRAAGLADHLTKMPAEPTADDKTAASAIFGLLVGSLPESILSLILSLPSWTKSQSVAFAQPNFNPSKKEDGDDLMDCPHPAAVWSLLLRRFEATTSVHRRLLIKQLITTTMDKDFDLFEANLSQICNRLSGMGETISESLRLGILLSGLPASASSVVSMIDSNSAYTYSQAVETLSNHFSRQNAESTPQVPETPQPLSANFAEKKNIKKGVRPYCTHCAVHGHTDELCWELHTNLRPAHLQGKKLRKKEAEKSEQCDNTKCPCHKAKRNSLPQPAEQLFSNSGFSYYLQTDPNPPNPNTGTGYWV